MGIYDRDYYDRNSYDAPRRNTGIRLPQTALGILLLANIALFFLDAFMSGELGRICALHGDTLMKPWYWWQFASYAFFHNQRDIGHLLFNMIGLWFFTHPLESIYGRKRILKLYFLFAIVGGVCWALVSWMKPGSVGGGVIGASGAVTGLFVLFCYHFPRVTILLFFVLPVPAWVAGVLLVGADVFNQVSGRPSEVAYVVHLGGAACAAIYYQLQVARIDLLEPLRRLWRRRPKLRVVSPEEEGRDPEGSLSAEVDRILEKITREGEASLTAKERRTLENAGRRYRNRRSPRDE